MPEGNRISKRRARAINAADGQFNDIARPPKIRANLKWFNVPDQTNNPILPIHKNRVDRKSHEDHMNAAAMRDDHSLSRRHRYAADQSFKTRQGRVSHLRRICQNRLLGYVKNFHDDVRSFEKLLYRYGSRA